MSAHEAWTSYPCPCCDKEFAWSHRRAQHIAQEHLKPAMYRTGMVMCWCGWWFLADEVQYHWAQYGGVAEHYVACLLGLD